MATLINSIVGFVKDTQPEQWEKFCTLYPSAPKPVPLLQERRTALISAAVTGKIDVRHWQPSVREQAW